MKHSNYTKALRSQIPEAAFKPAPLKLAVAFVHILIVIMCGISLDFVPPFTYPLIALVSGHSLACIAFISHEVSHGAVIRRSSGIVYPVELLMWSFNAIPATVWLRVHNQAHHAAPNSLNDPDRRFLRSEQTLITKIYSVIFYLGNPVGKNPLSLFHFVWAIASLKIASISGEDR